MDTILTDLLAYGGQYYMFHVRYNDTTQCYDKLNIYRFPFGTLAGGGSSFDLPDVRNADVPTTFMTGGAIVRSDLLTFILKVAAGPPPNDNYNSLERTASELYRARIPLPAMDSVDVSSPGYNYRPVVPMDAQLSTFAGSDGDLYTTADFGSGTILVATDAFGTRTFSSQINGMSIHSDDLCVVTCDTVFTQLPLDRLDPMYLKICIRRTPFVEFLLNGE